MKDIRDNVKKLQSFYSSLAQVINRGGQASLSPRNANVVATYIQQLKTKVQPYSKSIAFMLDDIQSELFVPNLDGTIGINPFRFGKLEAVLIYLESSDFVCNFTKYINTPWDDINNALKKLLEDSANASDRLSYNQVGVLAREIYIMLGLKVYKPEMNNREDGKLIGPTDTKGMISSYVEYTLKGSSTKDLRSYAENAIKLAEHVTHSKSETQTKIDMDSLVTSVVALVALINIIYKSNTI